MDMEYELIRWVHDNLHKIQWTEQEKGGFLSNRINGKVSIFVGGESLVFLWNGDNGTQKKNIVSITRMPKSKIPIHIAINWCRKLLYMKPLGPSSEDLAYEIAWKQFQKILRTAVAQWERQYNPKYRGEYRRKEAEDTAELFRYLNGRE